MTAAEPVINVERRVRATLTAVNSWSRLAGRARSLGAEFWVIPASCTLAAVAAAVLLTELDGALGGDHLPFLFPGGPDGARSVLSAVSSSMIAFTGLVFSITIVVLQLTSSQFSPRVLRNFLEDRGNQVSLGVFVATFTYALVVMRSVRSAEEGDQFVPRVAVTGAFLLLLGSVAVFIYYIHHIANSIRVVNIIDGVARETRKTIDRCYPDDAGHDATEQRRASSTKPAAPGRDDHHARVVRARRPGVIAGVDVSALVRLAASADATIALRHPVGTYVRTDMPLLDVRGTEAGPGDDELLATVDLRKERTLDQDVAFGFRQLVDIAERALSPSLNDPMTAIQVIDQLTDLLVLLVARPTPSGCHTDGDGRGRATVPVRDWKDHLDQAVDEIAHYGADHPPVLRALDAMFDDLADAAPQDRRAVVLRKKAALTARRAERQG